MSEWHDRTSGHLHATPVHRHRAELGTRHIVIAIGAAAAIVAVLVAVIWREKPANSATDSAAVESTIKPIASRPGTAVPQSKPVELSPPLAEVAGDGAWVVGKELKRGTYRTPGATESCYWAQLSRLTGDYSTLTSSFGVTGSQKVAIGPNVRAFVTFGCGEWVLEP